MAVNEDVSAYSNAAASNTPAGGDTVGPDLDNHLRDIKKNIRQVAEGFITVSDENFKGRIKAETAGSTHTLNYFADSGDMPFVEIDDSASTVTSYVDSTLMGAAAKNFNKQTTTASAQTALDLTIGTVGGQLLAETETASARSRLDLGTAAIQDTGTSADNVPQLISGSATSVAALPIVSGENLLAIPGLTQRVYAETVAVATITNTQIPDDDTIPQQSSDGSSVVTVSITPRSTANRLRIRHTGHYSPDANAANDVVLVLYRDAIENALAVWRHRSFDNVMRSATFEHEMTAPSTSSITFKIFAGIDGTTGIITINGQSGARKYGGSLHTNLIIEEVPT